MYIEMCGNILVAVHEKEEANLELAVVVGVVIGVATLNVATVF
jgi:hypothetical protein